MAPKVWIALLALAGAAACGNSDLERGASGAAIGAGVGEVVADEPLAGAAVGAAGGVLSDDM